MMRSPLNFVPLGRTGILVSRICLGTGTSGFGGESLQSRISPQEFLPILLEAHRLGVTFWDSSDDYGTHKHLALALGKVTRDEIIISTKTHASSRAEAERSIQDALRELGTARIDIFFLHQVDSAEALKRRRPAFETLMKAKSEGKIRAMGLSTHSIDLLELAVKEKDIDVIMTNFNPFEVQMDAKLSHYARALEVAKAQGKGVVVMKTLGEGRLGNLADEAIRYNLSQPFIDSVAVGITRKEEIQFAARIAREAES